jgi:hypothetical protein
MTEITKKEADSIRNALPPEGVLPDARFLTGNHPFLTQNPSNRSAPDEITHGEAFALRIEPKPLSASCDISVGDKLRFSIRERQSRAR